MKRLFALEARRAATGVLLPTAVLLALVLYLRPGPVGGPLGEAAVDAVARGLFRQDAWTAVLLMLTPLAAFHAARLPARWRAGAADWLGSRPVRRSAAILASWGGLAAVVAATLAGASLGIEARAGTGEEARGTPVLVGRTSLDGIVRLEPAGRRTLELEDAATSGLRARVRVAVLPGGDPTGRVALATRGQPEATGQRRATALVDGRTWLEVELPPGTRGLEVANDGGAVVALLAEPGIELWRQGGAERGSSLALSLRAALAIGSVTALAFAFATWISRVTAGAAALALWLTWISLAPDAAASQLPAALAAVGEGRLPGVIDGTAVAATAGTLATALGIAVRGLRSWRHAP